MPTTEVVIIPLLAGSDLGDPDNAAAAVFKDCGSTIRQADGNQELKFGTWVESPDNLQLFINWDSKQDHHDFMASNAYEAFLNRFKSIMSGPPAIAHVDFEPAASLRACTSAPVTEVATAHFDGAVPSKYLSDVTRFCDAVRQSGGDGLHGAVLGLTHEHGVEGKGKKGQALVLVIGWESVEAHMAFRETATFIDNVHLLRDTAAAIEMHHVALMEFVEG